MLSHPRILLAAFSALVVFTWVVVAETTSIGFFGLLRFIWPAGLLSIAVAWLFFTFAGRLFTWPRALRSVIACTAVLTPVIAYYFAASRDQTVTAEFLFVVAVLWASTLAGTLWNLATAADQALKEWLMSRHTRHVRRARATV